MSWKNKILLLFLACFVFIPFSLSLTPNESFDCVKKCLSETSNLLPACENICGVKPVISDQKWLLCYDTCISKGKPEVFCQNECKDYGPEKLIEMNPSISNNNQICLDSCINSGKPRVLCQNQCINPIPEKRIENTHIVEPASSFWEVEPASGFWEMLGFFALIIAAFTGWYFHKKNRRKTVMLLEMVDSTYEQYKSQQDLCYIELNKLKKALKEEFKKGNVDESNFDFIIGKIDKYLKELK